MGSVQVFPPALSIACLLIFNGYISIGTHPNFSNFISTQWLARSKVQCSLIVVLSFETIYFILKGCEAGKIVQLLKGACCSSRGLEFRFQNPCEMAHIKILFLFLSVCCVTIWYDCVCVHVCGWAWWPDEGTDPLELELHVVVCSLTWALGTEHWSSRRAAGLFTAEPSQQP